MKTTVTKWGNSLAIRIPKAYADQIGVGVDSSVELNLDKNQIVMRKPKPKYDLNELVDQISDANRHKEVDFGPSHGKEIW